MRPLTAAVANFSERGRTEESKTGIRADARGDPGRAAGALHANLNDVRSFGAGLTTDHGGIAWCPGGSTDFRAIVLSPAPVVRGRPPAVISGAGCAPAIDHVLKRLPSSGPTDLRNSYGSAPILSIKRKGTESESKRERSRRRMPAPEFEPGTN